VALLFHRPSWHHPGHSEILTLCCHYGSVMSADALLWICTLLFAATMLILSAMRRVEAAEGAFDEAGGDSPDSYAPRDGIDLGNGWTLGGDGRD
jgi:hypothetical protein